MTKIKTKHVFPQYMAEFIGTFFLVFLGCGAIILANLKMGSATTIPMVFGGTVAVMIYASGHISGAHFNPAVTLAFALIGRFPRERIFGYITSQISGAVLASALHSLLWDSGHSFGVTTPSLGLAMAFATEFLLSFLLMFVITAVATDSRAVGELAGIAIGTTVALCAAVGGPLTGASMNPARSLGPALLNGDLSQLWIYLLAPAIGAAAGALVYEKIRCLKEEENGHGCC